MHISIRMAAVAASLLLVAALAIAIYPQLRGGGASLSLAGTSNSRSPLQASGPAAPEFAGIVNWENSTPLTMASLRGKVVLVDFWTYSCINCQRTIPFLRQWYDKYKADGFVIVGVHSPEFDFEKNAGNIRRAIRDYGVSWPVAVDSNMATWNAYSNQYWPAEYLIDKSGHVRHTHFGEGEYDITERAIQALLAEQGKAVPQTIASGDPGITADAQAQTLETYAGSARGNGTIRLAGAWAVRPEYAELTTSADVHQAFAEIDYQARRVFVVAAPSAAPVTAGITLDGRDLTPSQAGSAVRIDAAGHSYVVVDHDDLYPVVAIKDFGHHVLRISPQQPGFRLYTFTFGS
jgi:thiol-disulfide isomerase/thioredoxin